MLPRIAVNCNVKASLRRRGDGRLLTLNPDYAKSILAAGGVPLLLPPLVGPGGAADRSAIDAALEAVDGVVFTGGDDMHPRAYGQDPHPEIALMDSERDAADLALMQCALERGLPILGICAGMQLLNVACGGTLHQHLPDAEGSRYPALHVLHRSDDDGSGSHPVAIEPGSRLAAVAGAAELSANSLHHQAVDRIGSGLRISARASDGVVEGIESATERFAIGVQWHPEEHVLAARHLDLFRALIDAARSASARTGAAPARSTPSMNASPNAGATRARITP